AHIKKKLPSMYHQFIKLANVDITKDAMEVGPTTHYVMGGIRVDADTQASTTVPGLFAAGECAAGINGANRLGGNSLSDLLVFGKRAGEYAAKYAKEQKAAGKIDEAQVDAAAKRALAPFEREGNADGPYQIQHALQEMMQELVGIVRVEEEMKRAVTGIDELKKKADLVAVMGNREYNPGWSTALDLHNLLTVSEAVARSALLRKESRGGHFRADAEKKSDEWASKNIVLKKAGDGSMQITTVPIPEMPPELKQIIEGEMK
ncbi:MAG: sdhA, partial [bacterium]|nr:sdhA [bacterium]